MKTCRGCGGILGRDCWNEMDCLAITHSEENRYRQQAEHAQVVSSENAYEIHLHENRINELENKVEYLLKLVRDKLGIDAQDNSFNIDDLPF